MITTPPPDLTLYRGTGNMALGPKFFERDAQGCAGGVEPGFMSATASRQVALGFAGMEEGKAATMQLPTLFVIHIGKTAIGANIADISQFEGEEEFLYPPLTLLELAKEPELSPDGTVSTIHLQLTVNQRSTTVEDAEQARRRFLVRHANSLQWNLRNWARQHGGLTQRLGAQIVGVLQRLLDEVHGAELAVLNTNEGYGQVFERIMRTWEEALRQDVVEALWRDGEQEEEAGRAVVAVRRFEEAIDAAVKLCSNVKEVRDRIIEMWRRIVSITQELVQSGEVTLRLQLALYKRKLADLLEQHRDAREEALMLFKEALELYQLDDTKLDEEIAKTLGGIGIFHGRLEQYQESIEFHQQALKIRIKIFGENSAAVAKTYFNIGETYFLLQNPTKALEYFEKDLSITAKLAEKDFYDSYRAYRGLGNVYNRLGRLEDALTAYQRVLALQTLEFGPDSLDVADSYVSVGTVLKNMGRSC